MTAHTDTSTDYTDMTSPLFAHQKASLKFMAKNKRVFDTSDPGTGKTRVAIEDFAARRRKKGGKALVLAPKSLLQSAWGADFKKFAPDIKFSIAYAANRKAALNTPCDVLITNHDAIKILLELPDSYWKQFDTLIVDESTAFKHHTSARSKALAKLAKKFEWRRLMTGTPTSNGVTDIWHQMFIVDDGKRLGKSFFAFRSAVCTPEQVGMSANAVKWVDKPHAEAIVSTMIKDVTIRHRFEDCVDIPENHKYSVPFELNAKHMAYYKELEAESVLMLKEGKVVSAINAAVLYNKLLQVASGAVYSATNDYSVIDNERYELVMELVEERQHSIVFFNWAHQRDELIRLAKQRKMPFTLIDGSVNDKKRKLAVEGFQAGHYKVMFAHPQSAGHGLTLTRGLATIWASPTYNLEHYLQGLKRVHRIGQTKRTETIMVIAPGTIDEKVYEALTTKDAKMTTLLNYLKEAA